MCILRFWYENTGVFNQQQLAEIRKTTLSKVICENGDNIEYIQRDVFKNAKFPRGMVKCSQIEDISLEPWRKCCLENPKGLCSEPAFHYTSLETNRVSKRDTKEEETSLRENCNVNEKTFLHDERWLKNKCTECICNVS